MPEREPRCTTAACHVALGDDAVAKTMQEHAKAVLLSDFFCCMI